MNKLSLLLVCLVLFLSGHTQTTTGTTSTPATPAPVQCQVGYYDVPQPPVCTTETGADGQPEQVCTAVGSAAYVGILDKANPTFSENNFPLNDIDWSGTCRCSLWVYSGLNLKGQYWLQYGFSKSKTKSIVVSQIWKRPTRSFKITCTF